MIKTYCDICLKEMTNDLFEAGHLVVVKKEILQQANPNIIKKTLDLCDECVNKVWNLLEEIKKEKEK